MIRRELVRGLGLVPTTSLVVGTIIGTGVFLKTARMAQAVGTPSLVLLAWVAAGLLSLAGALSYAELGAMLPDAGGEYVYLRAAYGDLPAFLFGWMRLTVGSTGSIASFGAAFATFLSALWPLNSACERRVITVGVILLFTAINCLRVTIGGRVQSLLTLAKVLAIASIAVGVFFFGPTATWEHLHAPAGVPAWCGFPAFGAAMLSALWAFDGWNNMPMAAGEVRDPGRNIPLALIVGMAIVLAVYGLLNLAYCYALPIESIAASSSTLHGTALPVAAKAAQTFLPRFGAQLVAFAALLSTIGVLNGSILTGARIPYAMARDGLFFARFAATTASARRARAVDRFARLMGQCSRRFGHVRSIDRLRHFCRNDFLRRHDRRRFLCITQKAAQHTASGTRPWGDPVVPMLFIAGAIWLLINTLSTLIPSKVRRAASV